MEYADLNSAVNSRAPAFTAVTSVVQRSPTRDPFQTKLYNEEVSSRALLTSSKCTRSVKGILMELHVNVVGSLT